MSEIQKCPNLIRGGAVGQQFSKMSEIQKSLKFPRGVKPIWEFFPNFSFFFMMAPLRLVTQLNLEEKL